jgi:fructose PTS system EIIBC or EIIC component
MKILGVTACPTGIAHTYMAAEAIESAAKKAGYDVKVETRGSVGVENGLTEAEIAEAEFIILACDTTVPMERFHGKKVLSTGVSDAIKNAAGLIEQAKTAPIYSAGELVQKALSDKPEGEKKSFFSSLFKK